MRTITYGNFLRYSPHIWYMSAVMSIFLRLSMYCDNKSIIFFFYYHIWLKTIWCDIIRQKSFEKSSLLVLAKSIAGIITEISKFICLSWKDKPKSAFNPILISIYLHLSRGCIFVSKPTKSIDPAPVWLTGYWTWLSTQDCTSLPSSHHHCSNLWFKENQKQEKIVFV